MVNAKLYRIAFKNNATGAVHKGDVTFNTEGEAQTHCDGLNKERDSTLKSLGEYIYIEDIHKEE